MRIGELATTAGVSVRALRYYEEQRLLHSERTSSGQRTYAPTALDRVQLIQQLYAAGLSSRAILDLLPCVDSGVSTPESRAHLQAERDRIDQQITGLLATRDRLDAVIAIADDPTYPCTSTDQIAPPPTPVDRDRTAPSQKSGPPLNPRPAPARSQLLVTAHALPSSRHV